MQIHENVACMVSCAIYADHTKVHESYWWQVIHSRSVIQVKGKLQGAKDKHINKLFDLIS